VRPSPPRRPNKAESERTPLTFKLKDPDAILDYGFNWQAEEDPYLEQGDSIATSTWSVAAPDNNLTIGSSSIDTTQTITIVWISAGTLGVVYTLTNQITTAAGRTDNRSMFIEIKQR
jgi:hypothetical protein